MNSIERGMNPVTMTIINALERILAELGIEPATASSEVSLGGKELNHFAINGSTGITCTFFSAFFKISSISSSVISLSFDANTWLAPCRIMLRTSSFPSLFVVLSTSRPLQKQQGLHRRKMSTFYVNNILTLYILQIKICLWHQTRTLKE